MGMRPKVSVVIPVFRVEDYIAKCIESLQRQTLKELEFIFIDDCGGDRSIEIAEEYAKTDDRIKILYNEENKGAGQSRNKGIDAATGEFIAFVDPDDWIDDNFYEVLYNRAVSGNYDIVKGDRISVKYRENGEIRYNPSPVNGRIKAGLTRNEPLFRYFTSEHQTAIFNCDMIQKNKIYNGSASHSENSVFLLGASYYAKRFCIESDVAYYYYQREDSSVHVFNMKKFSGEITSFKEQMEFIDKNMEYSENVICFLGKKVGFLLRRYNELNKSDDPELRAYRKEFLTEIANELDKVPNNKRLYRYGHKLKYLVDHKIGKEMMIFNFAGFISFAQKCKNKIKAVQRKIKNAVYHVESKTAIKKKVRLLGIPMTLNIDVPFDFKGNELIYLQNYRGCIIFCKEFLDKDPEFARDYINAYTKDNKNYNCNLPVDSEVYKEHLEYMKKGELCWRYTKRFGSISKTTIYTNENDEIMFHGEILGQSDVIDTEHFRVHPQKDRKLIDGTVLKDYIVRKSKKEMIGETRQYIDYIFDVFKTDDPKMLKGFAYDAFPFNCILTEGHVYELFDLEFEYKEDIEKEYMLFKIVKVLPKRVRMRAYYELCTIYHMVPRWEYWDNFNFRIWLDTISSPDDVPTNQENKELFAKYFI